MTESRGCHQARRGMCSRGLRLRDRGYGRERNVSARVHVCENVAKPMDQCERMERAASEQQDGTVPIYVHLSVDNKIRPPCLWRKNQEEYSGALWRSDMWEF